MAARCGRPRRGAVRARAGELAVIVGSPSFVVRGRGCPDSFDSFAHAAVDEAAIAAQPDLIEVVHPLRQVVGVNPRPAVLFTVDLSPQDRRQAVQSRDGPARRAAR